ncbi:MAG: DNA adenine methylase, partial [Campylobacterales bacterium]
MTAIINTTITKKYQPFIKWVGGKRGLLEQILPFFPIDFENYHEPFLGGGAVFFELYSKGLLKGKKIYLSDINAELINTYKTIKNNPNELIDNLKNFKEQHNKEILKKLQELNISLTDKINTEEYYRNNRTEKINEELKYLAEIFATDINVYSK